MTCPAPAGLLISADADGGRPGSGDARGEDEHERGDESAVLLVDLMAHVRAGDVRHGREDAREPPAHVRVHARAAR